MKRLSVNSFIITALLILSGCTVPIKNQRWYGDEGSQGAVYFETLTEETGHLTKQEWDDLRIGMACTETDTLAEIVKTIAKLCSVTRRCRYEEVRQVLGKFQGNIDALARFRSQSN